MKASTVTVLLVVCLVCVQRSVAVTSGMGRTGRDCKACKNSKRRNGRFELIKVRQVSTTQLGSDSDNFDNYTKRRDLKERKNNLKERKKKKE